MADNNLLSELAAFADSGEHTKFQLLQNWQEYKHYRKVRYSIKVVLKFLNITAEAQFKSYCENIISGEQDIYKLLAYQYIVRIVNCYLEELRIVQDMLEEYEYYLASGNWLDFILLRQRPIDKLWDHRGD
jgi:hypothetical protein